MEDENSEERLVRKLLEGWGFEAQRILVQPDEKRADYRVSSGGKQYLVEVKRVDEELRSLAPRQIGHWEVPLTRRNTLAGVTRDAAKQLTATPSTAEDLRVAWFVAMGFDADAYVEQLRATLYGSVDMVYTMQGGEAQAKPCYYFSFAEFFSRPELDAAVIGTANRGQFCINPFGLRVESVRACQLRKMFGDGALDPEVEEANGIAFTADFRGDRRDEASMLALLQRKYGNNRLIPFCPTRRTAMALIEH